VTSPPRCSGGPPDQSRGRNEGDTGGVEVPSLDLRGVRKGAGGGRPTVPPPGPSSASVGCGWFEVLSPARSAVPWSATSGINVLLCPSLTIALSRARHSRKFEPRPFFTNHHTSSQLIAKYKSGPPLFGHPTFRSLGIPTPLF
jgi:hypothetical protein